MNSSTTLPSNTSPADEDLASRLVPAMAFRRRIRTLRHRLRWGLRRLSARPSR